MVTTLQNFWAKHRKMILLGALLLLGAILVPHVVHAAPPPAPAATGGDSTCSTDVLNGISKIIDLLKRIFWPILLMIGGLLQNDILFGGSMEGRLNEIWVNVRNVVNILFVLVLVGIALYNVVGGTGENYHLKTILPKFVIALVVVNFTFIGAKVALDGVNIVSTALFALPDSVETALKSASASTTNDNIGPFTKEQMNGFCGALYGGPPGVEGSAYAPPADDPNSVCTATAVNGSYLNPKMVSFFSKTNSQNAALVMAITLQNASLLDTVNAPTEAPTCSNLVVNTLLSIVLFVIYGTAYVALFIVLLMRLVVLWVGIAVSPLAVLPQFLPEKFKGKLGGGEIDKFIQSAFVPIPVAIVMSIGIIMINGLKGSVGANTAFDLSKNPTLGLGLYTSGISTLQQLVGAFGAAAFIWMGVFEAMKGTFADGVVESIKGGVEGAGKALGGFAIKSIPLFPTAKGNITLGATQVALQGVRSQMDEKFRKQARELGLIDNSAEVGSQLGKQKDLAAFKKFHGEKVSRDQLGNSNIQGGYGTFFEGDGKKHVTNGDMKKWLIGTTWDGKKPEDFVKALKEGKVSQADMERFAANAGMPLSAGIEGAKPGTAGQAAAAELGGVTPAQKALLDAKSKSRKDLVDKKLITDPEAKELDDIKKTLDATAKSTKPEDIEKRKKALERLQQIEKQIENRTDAEKAKAGDASSKLGVRISTDVAQAEASEGGFKALEQQLQTEIETLAGTKDQSSEAYKKAKEAVLKIAGQKMSKDKQAGLVAAGGAAATGSLISQITPTEPPAPGGATGGQKPAGPGGGAGKPPTGGGLASAQPKPGAPAAKPPGPSAGAPPPQKPAPWTVGKPTIVPIDAKSHWEWKVIGGKGDWYLMGN